jgi:hypothetical protein
MKKLGGVFYFEFSFEDEETDDGQAILNAWAFTLTPAAIDIIGEDFSTEGEWFEELCGDIEGEFGVHDWGSSPVDEVVGVGFGTYEVSREDAPRCVERWRQEFVKKVGAENVSTKIYDIGVIEYMDNDLSIFNRVKALEE